MVPLSCGNSRFAGREEGLIAADLLLCCLGDRPQVGPILRVYAGRVEVVCQLLESVGGGLYPV